MRLEQIAGNTFYFTGSSMVGVYIFEDHSCLLVDSGDSKAEAFKMLEFLKQNNLYVYAIINTHAHADHCTGNQLIQDYSGCKIYASQMEGLYIENPLLTLYSIYSASPLKFLKNRYVLAEPSIVTDVIEPGSVVINNTAFTILGLSGHSVDQIGVVTPDEVAFIGDSLIAPKILNNVNFLYLVDVDNQMQTLRNLENINTSGVFLSHGGLVRDAAFVIEQNRSLLEQLADFIKAAIAVPKTKEEIMQATLKEFKLSMTRTQYYLMLPTISAFISYLCNSRQAGCNIDDGAMKFAASRKGQSKLVPNVNRKDICQPE